MKSTVFAAILLATACNALADEPYLHPYENGGYFEVQPVAAASPANEPYKHAYLNDGHFGAQVLPEAEEPGRLTNLQTATLH